MTMNYKAVVAKNHHIRNEVGGATGLEPKVPHQSVLDRIADRQISGGYSLKRKNLCPDCQTYRCANGTCFC